jgi:hypothetical protein
VCNWLNCRATLTPPHHAAANASLLLQFPFIRPLASLGNSVNKSTMSSAAATVPPQLSRDDARAMCAPANNLNAGFLQFETAHEGGGEGMFARVYIIHMSSLRRNAPSLFPNLLTRHRSLRASSRHFPPRIKRIRGAQLRVRHPTHAAGAGARGDGGANARHRGACNSSREFCDPHLQVPAHFVRFI